MNSVLPYTEEGFGILTDDELYLDCLLVKPAKLIDQDLNALRVWVPKYPLTKSSVITCARQEVTANGPDSKIAHLVFDLRSTGNSDGLPGDYKFQLDLLAIAEWTKERFGQVSFGFLGTPILENGRVYMWPLRKGTVMESYYYHPSGTMLTPPCILYLSTYGNFNTMDDAHCSTLAKMGYTVYGIDPLRYLLHASSGKPLTPPDLWRDLNLLLQMLPSPPILVAQPLAAGLAIIWASKIQKVRGVVAIGCAQLGLKPSHIFHNHNPYTYLVNRYTAKISPRPFAIIQHQGHALGGDEDELATLYQSSKDPRRLERTDKITTQLLLDLIQWINHYRLS